MKKDTEIDFIRNGSIEVPLAIGHSNVDIDYETAITANKLFDEHMVAEIAGKHYEFIARKRSESWSYIKEEGTYYSLNSVGNYHLRCETIDQSCLVRVERNMDYLDNDTNPFDGELSHTRMERMKKKVFNSGLSYSAEHHSEDLEDNNRILDIALAAHVAALGGKPYQRNWNGLDRWRHEFYYENEEERESLMNCCPNASSFVVAEVPFDRTNIHIYSKHIAFHNPKLDINLMLDICDVLNEIDECNTNKERASELQEKTLGLLGKFDRDTQKNMVRFLKSSIYPKAEAFIERSHKKVFEPEPRGVTEPSL